MEGIEILIAITSCYVTGAIAVIAGIVIERRVNYPDKGKIEQFIDWLSR